MTLPRMGHLLHLQHLTAPGKSHTELARRAQFATAFPTEQELSTAVESFSSWTQVPAPVALSPGRRGRLVSPVKDDGRRLDPDVGGSLRCRTYDTSRVHPNLLVGDAGARPFFTTSVLKRRKSGTRIRQPSRQPLLNHQPAVSLEDRPHYSPMPAVGLAAPLEQQGGLAAVPVGDPTVTDGGSLGRGGSGQGVLGGSGHPLTDWPERCCPLPHAARHAAIVTDDADRDVTYRASDNRRHSLASLAARGCPGASE